MFERFTARARASIVLAEQEAGLLGHAAICPEHLLLGLIHQGDGMAAKVLAQHGVTIEAARDYVAGMHQGDEKPPEATRAPFSPAAKKVLELSLREALRLGHNYIGTEHILLGLVREAGQEKTGWLTEATGARPADLATSVQELLQGTTALRAGANSPAVNAALARARGLAGAAPMTTAFLLWSVLDDEQSLAARALRQLGVTKEAVEAELAGIDIAETSDAAPTPEPVEIRLGSDRAVTIEDPSVIAVLRDLTPDELRRLLQTAVRKRRGRGPPRLG